MRGPGTPDDGTELILASDAGRSAADKTAALDELTPEGRAALRAIMRAEGIDTSGYQEKLDENRRLTPADLDPSNITQLGKTVLFGSADLARFQEIEGNLLVVNVGMIDELPENPRHDFNQTPLKELATNIAEFGILKDVEVVCTINKKTGQVRLMIVDGARRLRAVRDVLGLSEIPVRIKWHEDIDSIRLSSIISNLHREGHNDDELAQLLADLEAAYRAKNPECKEKELYAYLKKITGFDEPKVRNYRTLLEFPPEIRKLVAGGGLTMGRLMELTRGGKRGTAGAREKANNIKRATTLLMAIHTGRSFEDEAAAVGDKGTVDGHQARSRAAILSGDTDAQRQLEVEGIAHGVRKRIVGVDTQIPLLLDDDDSRAIFSGFLDRAGAGWPRERYLKIANAARDRLQALIDFLEGDIKDQIPALERVAGRPTFKDYAEECIGMIKEMNPKRTAVLRALATASDAETPTVLTYNQIGEATGLGPKAVTSVGSNLARILVGSGLVIATHTVREQRASMEKFPALRLEWDEDADTKIAAMLREPLPNAVPADDVNVDAPPTVLGQEWDPKLVALLGTADAAVLAPAETTLEPIPVEDEPAELPPPAVVQDPLAEEVDTSVVMNPGFDSPAGTAVIEDALSNLNLGNLFGGFFEGRRIGHRPKGRARRVDPNFTVLDTPGITTIAMPESVFAELQQASDDLRAADAARREAVVEAPAPVAAVELEPTEPPSVPPEVVLDIVAPSPRKSPSLHPKRMLMHDTDMLENGGPAGKFAGTYLIAPKQFTGTARAFYGKCVALFKDTLPELNGLSTVPRTFVVRLRVTEVVGEKFKLTLSGNVKGFAEKCGSIAPSLMTIMQARFPDCTEVGLEELEYPQLEAESLPLQVTPAIVHRSPSSSAPTPPPQKPLAIAPSTPSPAPRPAAAPRPTPTPRPTPAKAPASGSILAPISAGRLVSEMNGITPLPKERLMISPVDTKKVKGVTSVRMLVTQDRQKTLQSLTEFLLKIMQGEQVQLNTTVAGKETLVVTLRERDESGNGFIFGMNVARCGKVVTMYLSDFNRIFQAENPGKTLVFEEIKAPE